MERNKRTGYRYYVSKDMLDRYQQKPIALRLQWLYMVNILRMGYSKRTIAMQDRFRDGKM